MQHHKQLTNFGCVYATMSMILGGSESYYWQAIGQRDKRNRIRKDGAYSEDVAKFLERHNYPHKLIRLNNRIECFPWLKALSYRYPIYADGVFVRQGKRGRPAEDYHAFAICEGKIYDPAEDFELDYDARSHYSKLIIKNIIPIFKENKNFGKGLTLPEV